MPQPRRLSRALLIPLALGGLFALAAIILAPYADARLAQALDDLLARGLLLKAESLEVDLLGRRAVARNLRALEPYAPVALVNEIRLEGVNLYALAFGVEDSPLARSLIVSGVKPAIRGAELFSLDRAAAFELTGPFPGLLSLLKEPRGRAFGPAALRMRAGVLSVNDLSLAGPDARIRLTGFAGTDFSLDSHTSAVVSGLSVRDGGDGFSLNSAILGPRANIGPLAYLFGFSDPAEEPRPPATRQDAAQLHGLNVSSPETGDLSAGLLAGVFFSAPDEARIDLAWRDVRGVWVKEARISGDAEALLYALTCLEQGGETFSGRFSERGDNRSMERFVSLHAGGSLARIRLNMDLKETGRTGGPFPALQPVGLELVRADLEIEEKGLLRCVSDSASRRHKRNPQTEYETLVDSISTLRRHFPGDGWFSAGEIRQIRALLHQGGLLRISLHPTEPMPLLLLPDALTTNPPELGRTQSLNDVEAPAE